jgi:hypothetical protein
MTDEQKLRAARRLVEEVLAGEVGRWPMAGGQLEGVRQVLGMLAGDDRPDDPVLVAALARAEQTIREQQDERGAAPSIAQDKPKESEMEAVIIPAKTLVHIGGVPVALAVDTIVETAHENMALLTGYHYANVPESNPPARPATGAPETSPK